MIPIDFFKPVSSFIVSYLPQIICEVRFCFVGSYLVTFDKQVFFVCSI